MTDQPAAQPTPGPYYVHLPGGADEGCRVIRAEEGRSQGGYHGTEIACTVGLGNDAEDEANAHLLAASWATAAERGRLEVVNEELVKALDEAVQRFITIHRAAENGISTNEIAHMAGLSLQRVRAALDEARQS